MGCGAGGPAQCQWKKQQEKKQETNILALYLLQVSISAEFAEILAGAHDLA